MENEFSKLMHHVVTVSDEEFEWLLKFLEEDDEDTDMTEKMQKAIQRASELDLD